CWRRYRPPDRSRPLRAVLACRTGGRGCWWGSSMTPCWDRPSRPPPAGGQAEAPPSRPWADRTSRPTRPSGVSRRPPPTREISAPGAGWCAKAAAPAPRAQAAGLRLLCVGLLTTIWCVSVSAGRVVVDSAGRQLEVPDRVERVVAAGPPASVLMTILAPEKLV